MNTDNKSSSSSPSKDEWLENALNDTTNTYLMDDGFSARVIKSLPPRRIVAQRRPLMISIGAATGILIAALTIGREINELAKSVSQMAAHWNLPNVSFSSLEITTLLTLLFSSAIAWVYWRRAVR